MNREQFLHATRDQTWASIDLLKRRLDEADYWSADFIEAALDNHKKAHIRAEINAIRDGDGWPIFASVYTIDPVTGARLRVYKQEEMFDRDDYMQVVAYHKDRAAHHEKMAAGYTERARNRYSMKMSGLWPDIESVSIEVYSLADLANLGDDED